MKARTYDASDRSRWNELARQSRLRHFMLQREYMEYHADRFMDASMLVEDDRGKVVALFPASRHGDELVSHGGLTFGGILSTDKVGVRRTLEVLGAIIEAARDLGATSIRYKPAPYVYHHVPADEELYALFRAGATLARRDVSAAILLDHRVGYSKGRKHSVKQVPSTVRVERSHDFARFMAIEAEALERHGATATHSADELALLASRFPDNIGLHLAMEDDVAIAGVVTYDTPVTRHTQYIGATARGKEVGAADLVLDHLISDAEGRFRWFDFGISTERQGRYLNEGLASNKESYGARAVNYDHYDLVVDDTALAGLT